MWHHLVRYYFSIHNERVFIKKQDSLHYIVRNSRIIFVHKVWKYNGKKHLVLLLGILKSILIIKNDLIIVDKRCEVKYEKCKCEAQFRNS